MTIAIQCDLCCGINFYWWVTVVLSISFRQPAYWNQLSAGYRCMNILC